MGPVLSLGRGVGVSTPDNEPEDKFAVADIIDTLKKRGVNVLEDREAEVKIVLLRQETKKATDILARRHIKFSPAMHDEGYAVITDGKSIYDIAATSAGIYYGAQTIKQLVYGHKEKALLQGATIRDWPAMKYRGLSEDISRGPIPTLAFQKHEVRVLSEYKMNIYSPYFEVSLAYGSNPLLAPPGGAMTHSDVEELVAYAQKYHVTIIPDQEAFGHLHHALMFETYSSLGETPHGSALTPVQPGSVQLIDQWFREIASMFPGPFINIGADEVT
jgi:N-acetyl-beta-hexosaminidase